MFDSDNRSPDADGVVTPAGAAGPVGPDVRATEMAAAPLIRLLDSAVELVAEGYDPLAQEPAFVTAVEAAATALQGLRHDAEPSAVRDGMRALSAITAAVPDPWAPD